MCDEHKERLHRRQRTFLTLVSMMSPQGLSFEDWFWH